VSCPSGTSCSAGKCVCKTGLTSCNGTCVDLQTDLNNCGQCFNSCGSGLACSAGQCVCTANTPNGRLCMRPGQVNGVCWGGACVLAGSFAGCSTAADCVPGGCTGPGGYCLGTVDVAGQVSCAANSGAYIVCSASQGCTSGTNREVFCGNGSGGTGDVTCDGPSDCAGDSDCCNYPSGGSMCTARTQPGVIGSGCPTLQPGVQLTNRCDPVNPTANCAAGKSCVASAGVLRASFLCQ
jgi:hypothetical protein